MTSNVIDFKSNKKINTNENDACVFDDSYVLDASFVAQIKYRETDEEIDIKNQGSEIKVTSEKVLQQPDLMSIYLFLLNKIINMAKNKFNFDHETIMKKSIDAIDTCFKKEETND